MKIKDLNKGFTLALRCSYPTLLTKLNNSNYPVVSFEAAGFLYPKTKAGGSMNKTKEQLLNEKEKNEQNKQFFSQTAGTDY